MRVTLIFTILMAAVATVSCTVQAENSRQAETEGLSEPTTFEECVKAGNPILKSMPPQCVTKSKKIFVEGAGKSPERIDARKGGSAQGICLDSCGNGRCEEIVCMSQGCPCPEDVDSCPQDCN